MREKKRKVKIKKTETILGMAFAVCLLVFMVLNIVMPDREMSGQQNRMLAQRPSLSIDRLVSGTYMDQYEEYLMDQFMGRSILQRIQVGVKRLGGSKMENGIFIGKEDQLMEDIVTPDTETLMENLDAIELFANEYNDLNMYMLLVPDAANVLKDKLPLLATVADQNHLFAQVKKELDGSMKWIDAAAVLDQHSDEYIYYRTDKHWTSLGAFYVFSEAADILGIEEGEQSSFVAYPVSTTFNGILAANSGARLTVTDEIYVYMKKEATSEVVVNCIDEQKKTTSLFDSSKLETRDQYDVFLGGDTSVIDIKTVSESDRRLLLVKDSFANCFVQFLEPHFREIVVVDPRYYSGTIDDIMETYRITDVLFLYSGNTFFEDNNISGVFNSEQQD